MHHEFRTAEFTRTAAPTYLQVVCVVVRWNDGILLVHRNTDPFKGHWSIPGGNPEPGESYEQAAQRELYEETGIQADSLQPSYVFIDHDHQLECHAFTYDSPDGTYVNREPNEHNVVAWRRIPEALELPLTPGLHEALQRLP